MWRGTTDLDSVVANRSDPPNRLIQRIGNNQAGKLLEALLLKAYFIIFSDHRFLDRIRHFRQALAAPAIIPF
jgi:hypothetical protein